MYCVGRKAAMLHAPRRIVVVPLPCSSGVGQAKDQRKVFPAIGLVHFPFLAAFISANNAGLMPFFLHFLISDSLRLVMSKLLALHPLLEPDWLGASSSAGLEDCSRGRD
jgi:hypothetical protein